MSQSRKLNTAGLGILLGFAGSGGVGCGASLSEQSVSGQVASKQVSGKQSASKLESSGAPRLGALSCVHPPAAGREQEEPWSNKLAQRLDKQASSLAHCTANLPVGEAALILRLVYQSDGAPVSQHVVRADEASCSVSQCILEGLSDVWGPTEADVDPVSYDLQLQIRRGEAPRWTGAEIDPLMPDAVAVSCIDPDVQRLSKNTVYATVATTFPELKKCHAVAVQRDRSAAGLVTFEFLIGQQGQVAKARALDSTLYDCEAIECMMSQFRSLTFAPPVGRSVPVIFPIQFTVAQDSFAFR